MTEQQVLSLFKTSGALMEGHFILRSGRHSGRFLQCARVCEYLHHVERLATALLERWATNNAPFTTVLAPAMGALVIGQEVARQARKRFIFAEKTKTKLALRRGFKLAEGERVLVVEDVITRGGRAAETLNLACQAGGYPIGVATLVDRSEGQAAFPVPMAALLTCHFPTYAPDALPDELKAITPIKPGSG